MFSDSGFCCCGAPVSRLSLPSSFSRIFARVPSCLALLLVLGVALCEPAAHAQTAVFSGAQGLNFGTTAVASTSPAQTLTFTFTNSTAATIGEPVVLTQGACSTTNAACLNPTSNALDFALASGGSCNTTTEYGTSATNSCTVNVTFTPTVPRQRTGAVELTNSFGAVIATAYIYGTGTGPMVGFPPGTITTVAGNGANGFSGDGGPATSAKISSPENVAVDGAGNIYVADAANHRVRKVTASGTITTVAGNGTLGFGGDGGPATSAQLSSPVSVAVDGAGNLYIVDADSNTVRKLTAQGTILTVAGNGTAGFSGDNGPATSAQLSFPEGVAVDGAGKLYIADTLNNVIRKVTLSGTITTVAGNGILGFSGDNGQATSAQLSNPFGVASDGGGNLYIADFANDRVRKVTASGMITTVAGNGTQGFSGDNGPATSAELSNPTSVAIDGGGDLYIADINNNIVREVNSSGTITTAAGNRSQGYGGDNGPATSAVLFFPQGVAVDGAGNLYIADLGNRRIRKVNISNAPSLSFGITNVGATSGNTETVEVANIGNEPLTFETAPIISSNFGLVANTCALIPAGTSCEVEVDFEPIEAGNPLTGSLILTDNALNAASPAFATQTTGLSGTTPIPPPTVSGVLPNVGSPSGATTVTITGSYLTGATSVTFGSTTAASFTVVSATQIVAISPAGALGSVVNIVVTTPQGSSGTSAADEFYYAIPLTVATAIPSETLTAGTGANFTPVMAANGVPPYSYVISSGTLPTGLNINTGTGAISGTPTAPVANSSYTVTVTDAAGETASASFTLTVNLPNFVVTTAADDAGIATNCTAQSSTTAGTDASCSLRDALLAAANAGGSNIYFDANVFAVSNTAAQNTIALGTAGTLAIPSNTGIYGGTSGSGATLANLVTVKGNGSSTVFIVSSSVPGTVVANLTITGGVATGSGNASYGGGILNMGTLTVKASTITGNNATIGGGIANYLSGGTLTILSSTISGNSSSLGPGGIFNSGNMLSVISSTITGNDAGNSGVGGGIFNDSTASITNSTISANSASAGGGIFNGLGTLSLANSIVSGNSSDDIYDQATFSNIGGNVVGSYDSNTNPPINNTTPVALAPLGNYGGPTQTMIPLPGSPVICEGVAASIASGVTIDQRGELNTNANYPGYGATPCVDGGAVQTNYAISFTQKPSNVVQYAAILPAPAVTLTESGSVFTPAATIPLTLTGNGTLSGGSVSTSAGVATYSNLSVNAAGTNDALTATLSLNPNLTTALALTASSGTFAVTPAAPTVTAVSPTTGPATGGTSVTISGTDFTGTTSVLFGSTAATSFTVVSAAQIAATAPAGSLGAVDITVTTVGGTSATSAADQFTYAAVSPTLSFAAIPAQTYGNSPFTVSATSASSGHVTYAIVSGPATVTNNTVTITGAGSIVIQASQAASGAYAAATAQATVTVSKVLLSVAADNATKIYGTANPVFTGAVSGTVNNDSFTANYTTSAMQSSPVGTYAIIPNVTGSNSGDYTVNATSGSLTITQASSSLALSASANSITPSQSLTLTAIATDATPSSTGTPTGTIVFFDGNTQLGSAALASGTASLNVNSLAPSVSHSLTATYAGDTNFTGSNTSTPVTATVGSLDFMLGASSSPDLSATPGGTATTSFGIAPLYGSYPGPVSFSIAGLPAGASASFSPDSIAANTTAQQTVTLTIKLPQASASNRDDHPWRPVAPVALGLLLLPFATARRMRKSLAGRISILVLLFAASLAGTASLSGCGGSSATHSQNHTVTVTATAGSLSHSFQINLNVQ